MDNTVSHTRGPVGPGLKALHVARVGALVGKVKRWVSQSPLAGVVQGWVAVVGHHGVWVGVMASHGMRWEHGGIVVAHCVRKCGLWVVGGRHESGSLRVAVLICQGECHWVRVVVVRGWLRGEGLVHILGRHILVLRQVLGVALAALSSALAFLGLLHPRLLRLGLPGLGLGFGLGLLLFDFDLTLRRFRLQVLVNPRLDPVGFVLNDERFEFLVAEPMEVDEHQVADPVPTVVEVSPVLLALRGLALLAGGHLGEVDAALQLGQHGDVQLFLGSAHVVHAGVHQLTHAETGVAGLAVIQVAFALRGDDHTLGPLQLLLLVLALCGLVFGCGIVAGCGSSHLLQEELDGL